MISTPKRTIFKSEKSKSRDPRFDSLMGEFNKGLFQTSYSFVNDLRKKEVEELKSMSIDDENVKKTLTSLSSQLKHESNKRELNELKREFPKNYKLNSSKLRILQLKKKFDSMSRGNLIKLIEKKRIKNAKKDKRNLPRK